MQFPLYIVLPVTSLLALGACVTPDQQAVGVEQRVEARLQGQQTSVTAEMKPISLQGGFREALRSAVEQNPHYIAALSTEAAAFAQIGVAQSALKPQGTSNLNGGVLREGSPVDANTAGVAADMTITQLIYSGGGAVASIDGAMANALAARAKAQETGNTIALEAYHAWATLWASQQQLATLMNRTKDLETLMAQLEKLTENGMIDSATRDNAKMAELDIQMEIVRLKSAKIAAEASFSRYYGAAPKTQIDAPTSLFTTAELENLSKDISQAPSLRTAAAQLVAAEAAEAQARAQFKPTLVINSGITSPMDTSSTTDTHLGLQLKYTFNDGGKRKSQLEAAVAQKQAVAAELENVRKIAAEKIAETLASLHALDQSVDLMNQKVSAAETQSKTSKSQIASGQVSLRGVMDAAIADYRAVEENIKLTSEQLILQATIAAGTGNLLKRLNVK